MPNDLVLLGSVQADDCVCVAGALGLGKSRRNDCQLPYPGVPSDLQARAAGVEDEQVSRQRVLTDDGCRVEHKPAAGKHQLRDVPSACPTPHG